MALLFITHDLNLVRRFTHRVGVMERGKLVESGDTAEVFDRPQHAYTQRLLASRPQRVVQPVPEDAPVLLTRRRGREVPFADGLVPQAPGRRGAQCHAAAAARRDAGHRRRVGLGQDHAGHGAAGAAGHRRRRGAARRRAHRQRRPHRAARHAPAHAGGVPGPLCRAVAAHDGGPDRRRGPGAAPARAARGRARGAGAGRCSTRWA
jgi:hypothetical protein